MNFNIDLYKLAKWNLNPALYKLKQWRWIRAFIAPLNTLYQSFKAYRSDVAVRLQPNSQTIVMERLLNDLYDSTLRRIYIITESDRLPRNIFYSDSEDESNDTELVYCDSESPAGPVIYRDSEYANQYDFTVNVPTALSASETDIVRTVNNYRLRTKFFKVKYF